MFTEFTVSGCSLELLKTGEQGTIARFINPDNAIANQWKSLGLKLGICITLEQRFPSFIITAGENRLAIEKEIARSIYVRIDKS